MPGEETAKVTCLLTARVVMNYFWKHLFDTSGFPVSRMDYGHGWDQGLLFFSVTGEAFSTFSYMVLITVFLLFILAWRQRRIDMMRGQQHIPRVVMIYAISTTLSLLAHGGTLVSYWHPAYRLVGLFVFLAGLGSFAASLKTLFAFNLCVTGRKDGE